MNTRKIDPLTVIASDAHCAKESRARHYDHDLRAAAEANSAAARTAFTALVAAAPNAARSLSAAATALEFCRKHVPAEEWARLHFDFTADQFVRDAEALRAALANFPESK